MRRLFRGTKTREKLRERFAIRENAGDPDRQSLWRAASNASACRTWSDSFRIALPVQPVVATPSKLVAHYEGGVYERTEAERAFCGAESRVVEALESGPVTE